MAFYAAPSLSLSNIAGNKDKSSSGNALSLKGPASLPRARVGKTEKEFAVDLQLMLKHPKVCGGATYSIDIRHYCVFFFFFLFRRKYSE